MFKNFMTWQGMDPLTIRIMGSGEYVRNQVEGLVDTWRDAEVDNYYSND